MYPARFVPCPFPTTSTAHQLANKALFVANSRASHQGGVTLPPKIASRPAAQRALHTAPGAEFLACPLK